MSESTITGPEQEGAIDAGAGSRPTLLFILKVFLTAGAISFGGGVVAYLREYIVRAEKWCNDEEFLDALEVSQTLPGLNAVNLSVVIGDRLRGIAGACAAVIGILLPGMIIVMTLGVLWEERRHNPHVTNFLVGVAAAAAGLLSAVTLQLGHRQFTYMPDVFVLLATFIAVSFLHVSLVIVLLTIGPAAVWLYRPGSNLHSMEIPKPHPHFHGRHHLLRH
jgi:chromate transporter